MFSKTNASGELVNRPFLMIKMSETRNPALGLARLKNLGWNTGDISSVRIDGQVVTKKDN